MDLNEINDINGKKSSVLMLEDKKTTSESLAKRFDRKADELIDQQNKIDEDDPDFWKSECISRKRNLSLNSEGDAVINIADPKKGKVVEKWEDEWAGEEWADEEWGADDDSLHEEMKIDSEDEVNLA